MSQRQREGEMETASKELVNRLKNMHLFLYEYVNFEDCDENDVELIDDLEEVLKDAYKNLTSNFMKAMGIVDRLLELFGSDSIYFVQQFETLKKEMRFLRTSFRCMIKCCIEMEGSSRLMYRRLIYHLGMVETQVVNVAAFFSDYVESSPGEGLRLRLLVMVSERLKVINNMKGDVAVAYSDVTESSPSKYFMKEDSVVEFLDQIMENFHDLMEEYEGNDELFDEIWNLTEDLSFLRSLLDFARGGIESKEQFFICIEAVADKAAHVSFLCWIQKTNAFAYYQMKKSPRLKIQMNYLKSAMYNRMWKALLLPLNTPLTDELLVGFMDFLFHHLILLLEDGETTTFRGSVRDQVNALHKELKFLRNFLVDPVLKHFAEEEILYKLNLEIEVVTRNIGSAISSFDGNLMLSDFIKKVELIKDSLIQLENEPLSDKLVVGFLDFLYHNLIELPKVYDVILVDETKDQLEIANEELCFMRHFRQKHFSDEEKTCVLKKEIDAVARKIASVVCPCFSDTKKEDIATAITSLSLPELLKNLRLIKASVIQLEETPLTDEVLMAFMDCLHNNVIELLKDIPIGTVKDQFQLLNQELGFLRNFIAKPTKDFEKLHGLRIEIEAVARKIGSVVYSCFSREMKENMAPTINKEISDLLSKISHVKTAIIQLEGSPLTDELLISFVGCLQHNLIELVKDGVAVEISRNL